MTPQPYRARLDRCSRLMKAAGPDALLLTKSSNMFYLTGDGRLCSYALITKDAEVALGVPQTDVTDVTELAHFDDLTGFEDEVGMIHGIAHHFEHVSGNSKDANRISQSCWISANTLPAARCVPSATPSLLRL